MLQILDREKLRFPNARRTTIDVNSYSTQELATTGTADTSLRFRVFKRCFDYGLALMMMPIVAAFSLILTFLNPFLNPGPVFFVQERMGRDGKRFWMYKLRTMTAAKETARAPNAKLEQHRITRLGRLLRKTHIDELPNFINVLRGDMSVVGPRPDAFDHAAHFNQFVDGYKARHRLRPGITGLAQVEQGYVEGEDATYQKARYDNYYVTQLCGRLELYVIARTVALLASGLLRPSA